MGHMYFYISIPTISVNIKLIVAEKDFLYTVLYVLNEEKKMKCPIRHVHQR